MLKFKKALLLLCFLVFAFFSNPARAASSPSFIRLGGNDRYETAVKISKDGFGQSDYVVLTSGKDFPDALCAAPLAEKYNAPILLTGKDSFNDLVAQEIKRLGASHAFIIGGTGVISTNVENQLKALGMDYERIGGLDRYETSVKVAAEIGTGNGIVLASGEDFPDSLSIASIAAAKQMPILLTQLKAVPGSIKNFISASSITKSYIVGGTAVISQYAASTLPEAKRLYGADRYSTNLAVIDEFSNDLNFSNVYLATGRDFADALGGSAAAAKISAPIVLTDNNSYKAQELFRAKSQEISMVKVLGGTSVLSDTHIWDILNPAKFVLGYTIKNGPYDNTSYNSLVNNYQMIDGVATYTYTADGSGNITGYVPTDVISFANSKNESALALITNNFSGDTAKSLLESQDSRNRLISNIVSALKANNYKGVNIDFEGIYSYDRTYFSALMRELYNTLHPMGFTVTVDVPAKTGDNPSLAWSGAYDYAAISQYADQVMLMTYDEHWSGGAPGPIASIGWVQKVVNYALTVIPRGKIVLGIAAYGYDWPANGSAAKAYSISQAYNTASSRGAAIQWDSVSQSPYYNYTDSNGVSHTVFFENSTSIGYKLDIVNNYNLRGIAVWRLGLENADFWTTIDAKFNR